MHVSPSGRHKIAPGNHLEIPCQGTRLMIINYCQRSNFRKELRSQGRSRHASSGLSLYRYDDLSGWTRCISWNFNNENLKQRIRGIEWYFDNDNSSFWRGLSLASGEESSKHSKRNGHASIEDQLTLLNLLEYFNYIQLLQNEIPS